MVVKTEKTLNLALQGGGSHGAFTWGALDCLLADGRLAFEGISGTSSGAMNAAVLVSGLVKGGNSGAREALRTFWETLAREFSNIFSTPFYTSIMDLFNSHENPAVNNYLALTRTFSPYQLNPMDMNPLRELVAESVDFDLLRKDCPVKLFIAATQVKTGKLRIFENHELSCDTLMASACLPSLHQAVEIEGESYWDGGFSGNPPVFPLIFSCQSTDIAIIMVQPLEIDEIPTTVEEIQNRTSELGFNSAFLREMRAIAFSKKMVEKEWIRSGKLESRMHNIHIHMIQNHQPSSRFGSRSRYNTLPSFIDLFYREGYTSAETWLEENYMSLGERSTIDIEKLFC